MHISELGGLMFDSLGSPLQFIDEHFRSVATSLPIPCRG